MSNKLKWNGGGSIKSAMRYDLILLCLCSAIVFYLSVPVLAQDGKIQAPSHPSQPGNVAKVEELQALIDAHELDQVGPLWQSFIQGPFRVDKTQADEQLETDEHVYWMN